MAQLLDDLLGRLNQLPPTSKQQVIQDALAATKGRRWIPNPGPQTNAFFCDADELFYGGSAGGGKSDLIVGLSLTEHKRSLVLRRTNKEASKLFERYRDIIGDREGWNGQDSVWRLPDGRVIDIGGCQLEDDKQKYKGTPHDLIGFDEVSDFTESQYTFITIWNRSADPSQRCRVVAAGNPPTRPEGLWVIEYWAPWLDPTHPNPAKPGELRWFLGGKEVNGPGPHLVDGTMVRARSRTFIPAKLEDNPDLAATNYDSVLAGLPEELRLAYREGRFDVSLQDDAFQVIPTAWVKAAQARWTSKPPHNVPMCAMGVDASGGGNDPLVIAPRYDGWYPQLIRVEGKDIPMERIGKHCAGVVISHRLHGAKIIVDMGGGYGGPLYEQLIENIGSADVTAYKGAEASVRRTKDQKLGYFNKRTQAYWQFREALDPSQEGGSPIALPPEPRLVADLTAPTFEITPRGIKVESKEHVCDRLGRSTDEGDAVVMAWYDGARAMTHAQIWTKEMGRAGRTPSVNYGPRRPNGLRKH